MLAILSPGSSSARIRSTAQFHFPAPAATKQAGNTPHAGQHPCFGPLCRCPQFMQQHSCRCPSHRRISISRPAFIAFRAAPPLQAKTAAHASVTPVPTSIVSRTVSRFERACIGRLHSAALAARRRSDTQAEISRDAYPVCPDPHERRRSMTTMTAMPT